MALSVVIPTLNEAERVGDAVRSALAWADEVLVIDGGSTDDTAALAAAAGATVLHCPQRTIGAQRNVGIAQARHEWVLALDCDERAAPELVADLAEIVASDGALASDGPRRDAFDIRVREHLLGRELTHGTFSWHYKTRLFRRRFRFTEIRTHEKLEPVENTGRATGTILHHSCRDMRDQLRKMVMYSSWQADEMYAQGKRAGVADLLLRPLWRFVREYVVYGAWRGGTFALIQSCLAAMSSFTKYAFLWVREDAERRAAAAALGAASTAAARAAAERRAAQGAPSSAAPGAREAA